MGPADFLLLVQMVQAAIKAAPQVIEVAKECKDFVAALFTHGVITAQQQNDLHNHVDVYCDALVAGTIPPSFQVEADPT